MFFLKIRINVPDRQKATIDWDRIIDRRKKGIFWSDFIEKIRKIFKNLKLAKKQN